MIGDWSEAFFFKEKNMVRIEQKKSQQSDFWGQNSKHPSSSLNVAEISSKNNKIAPRQLFVNSEHIVGIYFENSCRHKRSNLVRKLRDLGIGSAQTFHISGYVIRWF